MFFGCTGSIHKHGKTERMRLTRYALRTFPNLFYNMVFRLLKAYFVLHIWFFPTFSFISFLFGTSNSLSPRCGFARMQEQTRPTTNPKNPAFLSASFLEGDINIKNSKWILIFFFLLPFSSFTFMAYPLTPRHTILRHPHFSFHSLRFKIFFLSPSLPYMNLFLLLQCPTPYRSTLLMFWWFSYGRQHQRLIGTFIPLTIAVRN